MSAPSSDKAGIRQTIRALRNAGYELDRVYNGGDEDTPVSNETEALEEIMATDDATLWVKCPKASVNAGKSRGVYFVLGNSPDEVICDYHVSLSHVLDPLIDSWIE